MQQLPRKNGFKLPEYLELSEVNALIAAPRQPKGQADNARTMTGRLA